MVRIIRWVCEPCDKKWIHPVDNCIYCNNPIKKVVGKTAKVVGFTKVYIPNPLHPVVPYNVLILEDENGNRMPKKTIKDYAMGDSYENNPDGGDSAVSIVRIKYDHDEAVKEAIELIGGLDVNGKKVLIKPNLSVPGYSYLGLCTNPIVLESLIEYCKNNGASDIAIAEQSFFVDTDKAVVKSGVLELIEKHKLKFIDISKTEFEEKTEREFNFEISKILGEYEVIINVPVIKTDMYLNVDGAFENLTRFLSKKNFEELSQDPKKAAMALAVLPNIMPKFVTIGDGSIGTQGNGPAQYGEPGFYNLIFASRNPVVHDRAVQEVLCLKKTPYIELASQLGVGEFDISKINFIGNELDALRRDIKQPIGSKLIKK